MVMKESRGGFSLGDFLVQLALEDQDRITSTTLAQIERFKLVEHRSDCTLAQAARL